MQKKQMGTKWLAVGGLLATTLAILWLRADLWLGRMFSTNEMELNREQIASLERLWKHNSYGSQKNMLIHLKREMTTMPGLFERLEGAVRAATQAGDLEIRELAFEILTARSYPDLSSLAVAQLADADPAIRLLGLRYVRVAGKSQAGAVMPLLDDPETEVARNALLTLRQTAGQLVPASHQSSSAGGVPDEAAFQREIKAWKDWWNGRRELAQPAQPDSAIIPVRYPQVPKIAAQDISGKPIQLGEPQGTVHLISFFDHHRAGGISQLETLDAFQKAGGNRLAILAVCLQTGPKHSCDEGHSPEAERHHAEEMKKVRAELAQLAQQRNLSIRIILDPHEELIRALDGCAPETSLWIDASGRIHRRYIGARTIPTMGRMLKEILGK